MKKLILWVALSAFVSGLIAQTNTSPATPQGQTKDKAATSPAPPTVSPIPAESNEKNKGTVKPVPPTAVPATTSTPPPVKKDINETGTDKKAKKDKKSKKEKKAKKNEVKEQKDKKVVPDYK